MLLDFLILTPIDAKPNKTLSSKITFLDYNVEIPHPNPL
jgi:hypothetical protein